MTLTLIVPGRIQPKQRPRFNTRTGKAFTPQATATYENYIRTLFITKGNIKSLASYSGPLKVKLRAYFEIPVSKSKKQKELMIAGGYYHTKKPDCDNILKILDALNGLAFHDDSQIVESYITKAYDVEPRLEIEIDYLEMDGDS